LCHSQELVVPRQAIDANKCTAVLTGCGRFDLLEETISTFLDHFDPGTIHVAEDSGDHAQADALALRFPAVEMHVNASRLGQMRSIDQLYARVDTPYVLHLEDDWLFSGSVDLDRVMRFMDARPDISVVCIGYRLDKRYQHRAQRETHDGIDYLVWDVDAHPKWFSYSFNPSIGRLAFWRAFGPFEKFVTEENISAFCKGRSLRIAMIVPSLAEHIGDARHTPDPFQPARAKTLLARLSRSVAKRLPNLTSGERFGCR
jgi:hypothetical protein